jgi:hypothetical protein
LLAVLLIGASAAKARRVLSARGGGAQISPTVLFPLHLRRPLAIALCTAELALGIALVVTIGSFGAGLPAMVIRALAALLFLTAVGALQELRTRNPEAGCGCFGDLSHAPVSWRVLARSVLLSAAALATVTTPPALWITSPAQAWLLAAAFAAELGVLAALSPEVGEAMVRLGYSEPCELRVIPAARTLTALRASAQWRRYHRYLATTEPSDVWREGCWRFAVFPGIADGTVVDIVFAVYMQTRRPPIRAALVDVTPDETAERISTAVPVQRADADDTDRTPDDADRTPDGKIRHPIGRLIRMRSEPRRSPSAVTSREQSKSPPVSGLFFCIGFSLESPRYWKSVIGRAARG